MMHEPPSRPSLQRTSLPPSLNTTLHAHMHNALYLVRYLDSSISTPFSLAASSPLFSIVDSPPFRPISWYPSLPICSARAPPPLWRPGGRGQRKADWGRGVRGEMVEVRGDGERGEGGEIRRGEVVRRRRDYRGEGCLPTIRLEPQSRRRTEQDSRYAHGWQICSMCCEDTFRCHAALCTPVEHRATELSYYAGCVCMMGAEVNARSCALHGLKRG